VTGDEHPAELFQLDRPSCLALLSAQHVGRLVVGEREPVVVPVNYRLLDGCIVFRTTADGHAGRPRTAPVAFEVDMFDDRTRSGWSVVVRGPLSIAPPELAAVPVDSWAPGRRERWMVVPVDVVTGRLLRGAIDAPVEDAGGYL
jgi:nitroimidazol reductase NimA-like FMN-containing flavoprotein (pyridoxamine 5'-phosphate oxidase superfamily)